MDSKILLKEAVHNSERRFGSTNIYYPVKVITANGDEVNALFTEDQIDIAAERATRNPEDIPEDQSFWDFLTD